jgi:Transketolase, thiamine diphosphate binding domain
VPETWCGETSACSRESGPGCPHSLRSVTATDPTPALDKLSIDTIRTLSMDAVQKANSCHPGTPTALAPLAYRVCEATAS